MNVTVRYHGIIGDMLRRKTQQLEMPDGATVSDLLAAITDGDESALGDPQADPRLHRRTGNRRNAPLTDGAEVTFMRPIAGVAAAARLPPPEPSATPYFDYFDAVEPAGKLRPPVCGSGCAPGTWIAQSSP